MMEGTFSVLKGGAIRRKSQPLSPRGAEMHMREAMGSVRAAKEDMDRYISAIETIGPSASYGGLLNQIDSAIWNLKQIKADLQLPGG